MEIIIEPFEYPKEAGVKIDECFTHDGFYARQRENDVLLVNTISKLICLHPVGFFSSPFHSNYKPCTSEEFIQALNTTIFEMQILTEKYKI